MGWPEKEVNIPSLAQAADYLTEKSKTSNCLASTARCSGFTALKD